MKLLSKLSALISAVARGPANRRSGRKRTPLPDVQPPAPPAAAPPSAEQKPALEGGRVADMLQRKLATSEPNPPQQEKGD
jgi:hypothetical protein